MIYYYTECVGYVLDGGKAAYLLYYVYRYRGLELDRRSGSLDH